MKAKWELNDYIVIGLIVLFIVAFCFSCARGAEQGRKDDIEAAYTEGYEQGYYDGENGNPYNFVR
jgi:uncharacterized membrane protein YukC